MTETNLVELLERGYDGCTAALAAVPADRLDAASPCAGWSVRDVANHLVGAHLLFARIVEGEELDAAEFSGGSDADHLGSDPGGAYGAVAKRCLAAFRRPGALEETFPFAFGPAPGFVIANISLSESLVHGWDIARGAGVPYVPDDDAAAAVREFQSQGTEEDRTADGMFGPALPAPTGASAFEALLAFLGRTP